MSKRSYGNGSIDQRGENTWRLRYIVNGRRIIKTVRGSKADARKELRASLGSVDTGKHVVPDKVTVAEWIERWIALLEREAANSAGPVAEVENREGDEAPSRERKGRKRGLVNRRT